MSLLGNLITQVARQALDPEDGKRNPVNQRIQPRQTGGLGDILGSVLGGQQQQNTGNNGFGMDDILSGMMGSQRGDAGGLGSVLSSVLGNSSGAKRSGGGQAMLIAALMPMVLGWIKRNGGLSGAISKVQEIGFGKQSQSWMSTQQQNENIDPNQIDKLFDEREIQQVCQQVGADENEVRQGLSELLPEVVNQLTPTGGLDKEQEANFEIEEILQQISSTIPR